MKKIEDMEDMELDSYIKQCTDITNDKRMLAMIEIEPAHEIAVNAKTLSYRLREEKLNRSVKDLQKSWDEQLSDIEFDPLQPEEMELVYPELKKFLDTQQKEEDRKANSGKIPYPKF